MQLSDEDVRDAARLMRLLTESCEAKVTCTLPYHEPQYLTREMLVDAARTELEARRRRVNHVSEGMFGEPGWEMLLLLYIEHNGARLNIARLTGKLNLPLSSALRWLHYLQDRQLVQREGHPTDQRSVFVRLTEKALKALDSYFSEGLTRKT